MFNSHMTYISISHCQKFLKWTPFEIQNKRTLQYSFFIFSLCLPWGWKQFGTVVANMVEFDNVIQLK